MIDELSEIGRQFGLQGQRQLPADFRVEPWMVEFVKGRHHQEEWDAFFVYCEAGPFKRFMIHFGSFIHYMLGG